MRLVACGSYNNKTALQEDKSPLKPTKENCTPVARLSERARISRIGNVIKSFFGSFEMTRANPNHRKRISLLSRIGILAFLTVFGCQAVPIAAPAPASNFQLLVNQTLPSGVALRGKLFRGTSQSDPTGGTSWTDFNVAGQTSYFGYNYDTYESELIPASTLSNVFRLEVCVCHAVTGAVLESTPRGTVDPFVHDGSGKYRLQ